MSRRRKIPSERLRMPESVKAFVPFVGWGRSGNSFLGQVLNGHPNAMVANEGKIDEFVERDASRDGLYSYLVQLDRGFERRGYKKRHEAGDQNLVLPGAFQGKRDALTVIGNSKAGRTRHVIYHDRGRFEAVISGLDLAPRIIFLTRHPRNIIGSMMKRAGMSAEEAVAVFRATATEADWVDRYLSDRYDVFRLAYEDFVSDPRGVLAKLLDFVGLPDSPALADAAAAASFKTPAQSGDRHPELAAYDGEISRLIDSAACLQRYKA